MNRFSVKCPSCLFPLPADYYDSAEEFHACSRCGARVSIKAMPALYRKPEKGSGPHAAGDEDAVCYHHSGSKAEQVCSSCGRFLCGLCALPFGEETLCVSCLEAIRRDSKSMHRFKPRQFRHDKLALGLAVLPLLIYFPTTVFTAPAALVVALRYWRREIDFAKGWRFRMWTALVFSILEIVGWLAIVVVVVRSL